MNKNLEGISNLSDLRILDLNLAKNSLELITFKCLIKTINKLKKLEKIKLDISDNELRTSEDNRE